MISSNVYFNGLKPLPPDPILGLMSAYREDTRTSKIDLSVGIYKDKKSLSPIMGAVKQAEKWIQQTQTSKAYEGPKGNKDFCNHIDRLITNSSEQNRNVIFGTPGGNAAIRLALEFIKQVRPNAEVWISEPTWPNHFHICKSVSAKTNIYAYNLYDNGQLNLSETLDGLSQAKAGDVLLLQGSCHNPTGTVMSKDDWVEMAQFIAKLNLLPVIDIAYNGFTTDPLKELSGPLQILKQVPEAFVCYSCSKNFSLYRERVGALLVQAENSSALAAISDHLENVVRASYAMPPSHGQAVVSTILADRNLTLNWTGELQAMRERMLHLRTRFANQLSNYREDIAERIKNQSGMFSQLKFIPHAAEQLRNNHAVYLLDSGRINLTGLPNDRLEDIADTIAKYLED